MKRILTPKRNRDAKGSPLNVSISIGHRMNKRIQSRIDQMIAATERDIKRLFDGGDYTGYAMDENTGSQARINNPPRSLEPSSSLPLWLSIMR